METIVINDSDSDDNNDNVTSQYRMPFLRAKDEVDTSDDKSSNDKSNEESNDDAYYWHQLRMSLKEVRINPPPNLQAGAIGCKPSSSRLMCPQSTTNPT